MAKGQGQDLNSVLHRSRTWVVSPRRQHAQSPRLSLVLMKESSHIFESLPSWSAQVTGTCRLSRPVAPVSTGTTCDTKTNGERLHCRRPKLQGRARPKQCYKGLCWPKDVAAAGDGGGDS